MNTCIGIKVGDAKKAYSRGDVMEAEKGKTLRFYKNITEAVLYSNIIDPVSLEPRMFYEVAASNAKESSMTSHIMEDRWLFILDVLGVVGALFDCCSNIEDDPDTMMCDKPPAEADISNRHVFNVGKSSKTYAGSLAIVCNGRKGASLNADVDRGVLISAELTDFRSYGNDTKVIALNESSRITAHGCRNVLINVADDVEITVLGDHCRVYNAGSRVRIVSTGKFTSVASHGDRCEVYCEAEGGRVLTGRAGTRVTFSGRKDWRTFVSGGSSRFSLCNFHTLKSLRG